MKSYLRGMFTGASGGVIGALCCLGPTVLIMLGIGAFFGINAGCYAQYRPQFLVLGFSFLAISTLIYFRNQSLGVCKINQDGKIKFTLVTIVSMLIVYLVLITFVVPYLQSTFLPKVYSCSI